MNRVNKKIKLIVFILGILSAGLFIFSNVQAMINDENTGNLKKPDIRYHSQKDLLKNNTSEYAPGELVIKLKEGKNLQDIQELNTKYNVSSADNIFKKIASPEDALKQLKDKLANVGVEHQSWYWQLDKNSQSYKDYVLKIEKEKEDLSKQIQSQEGLIARLEQRQKRAIQDAAVPHLDNIYLLKAKQDTNIPDMAKDYTSNLNVAYAEPNYVVKVSMVPNDPYYSSSNSWGQSYDDLWGLKKIQADKAWDISQGQGVVVAVIDTGVDYNHEDIAANIWTNTREIPNNGIDDDNNGYVDDVKGWDFVHNGNNPLDDHGHGTHVSGTIAAVDNNNKGIIGVAPKAKIMAVKGLNSAGSGYISDLAKCLIYAADNGADVLSNSWGGSGYFTVIEDAVNYAYSKGCVVVAAAGNSNADAIWFSPAGIKNVIAVASTDHNDTKSDFSNYGYKVDVAAPGGDSSSADGNNVLGRNILSLRAQGTDMYGDGKDIVGNNYYRSRGTSMACPHVSGLSALILSHHPEFTNDQVRMVLSQSTDAVISNKYIGTGRINAYKALQFNRVPNVKVSVTDPGNESTIKAGGQVQIKGAIEGSDWSSYTIEFGSGLYPTEWSRSGITLTNTGIPPFRGDVLGVWDVSSITEPGTYTLKITVSTSDGQSIRQFITGIYLDPTLKNGWPQKLAWRTIISREGVSMNTGLDHFDPVVADINNDGLKEIIVYESGDPSKLFVFKHDGTPLEGWPKEVGVAHPGTVGFIDDWYDVSIPLVGDLDNDGHDDIVVWQPIERRLYAFKYDGSILPGWPVDTPRSLYPPTYVMADLNRDGKKEIVFLVNGVRDPVYDGTQACYIFNSQGQTISHWLLPENTVVPEPARDVWYSRLPYPVVGNFDDNPDLEIVILSSDYNYPEPSYLRIVVSVYKKDGSIVPGWPKYLTKPRFTSYAQGISSPVVGDINNDGKPEIIIAADVSNKAGGGVPPVPIGVVYALDKYGTMLPGWPFVTDTLGEGANCGGGGSPALADIDGDGKLEIIVTCTDGKMYALRNDGSVIAGWPRDLIGYDLKSPVIADINGDGSADILTGLWLDANSVWYATPPPPSGFMGAIWALNRDGTPISGFSKSVGKNPVGTTTISDVDNDGKLDIISSVNWYDNPNGTASICVWETPFTYNPNTIQQWPTFQHDNQRTGLYETQVIVPPPINTPQVPSNLTATAISSTQINLSWADNSYNEDGFKVERKIGASGAWAEIATVSANITNYSKANLTASTTYYYRVRAYNSAGTSGYSNEVNATTLVALPFAPSNLTATAISSTQINISWQDNSDNETGFKIERSFNGVTFTQIAIVGASNTVAFNNAGLAPGTIYYYRVRAYNISGSSAYSNVVQATTLKLPIAPSNLTARAISSSQINLSWRDRSNNEDGFKIERSLNGLNFSQIAVVGSNITSYINKGLISKKIYYYRVRAYNKAGNSGYSNKTSARTR